MKIIGIIGTRKRNMLKDFQKTKDKFFEIYEEGDWICSGGCKKGGDRFANEIAEKEGIPILTFYPNYKRYSRGAPFVRNTFVAEKANVIIACVVNSEDGLDEVLKRKTGGTEDTIRKHVKFIEENDGVPEVYLV